MGCRRVPFLAPPAWTHWQKIPLNTRMASRFFHGRYVSFDKVDAHPRPVQAGGPRIVIVGHSPAAFRRAVARGHGWFGNGTLDDLVRCLDGLKRAATEVERPARLGPPR